MSNNLLIPNHTQNAIEHQLRWNNAGENKLLEQRAKSKAWQLGWQVEFTSRDKLQHNHLAEQASPT